MESVLAIDRYSDPQNFQSPHNTVWNLKQMYGEDLSGHPKGTVFHAVYHTGPNTPIECKGKIVFDSLTPSGDQYDVARKEFPDAANFFVTVHRGDSLEDENIMHQDRFDKMIFDFSELPDPKKGPLSTCVFDCGVVFTPETIPTKKDTMVPHEDIFGGKICESPGVYLFGMGRFIDCDDIDPDLHLKPGQGLPDDNPLAFLMRKMSESRTDGPSIPSTDDLLSEDNPHKRKAMKDGSKKTH